jgi:hypothetical protein
MVGDKLEKIWKVALMIYLSSRKVNVKREKIEEQMNWQNPWHILFLKTT